AYLDALDAGLLYAGGCALCDLVADPDDLLFGERVEDVVLADAAHDAVAERLQRVAALHDRRHRDAVGGPAVLLDGGDVLRPGREPAGQVSRVRGLQGRVGESLARAVGRDEVLEDREALAEVGRDRRLDDLARGLGHQSAHSGELPDLLLGSAGARIRHDVYLVGAR